MVAVAHWGTDDEKLSAGKAVGIAFGILGVIVLVGPGALGRRRRHLGRAGGDRRLLFLWLWRRLQPPLQGSVAAAGRDRPDDRRDHPAAAVVAADRPALDFGDAASGCLGRWLAIALVNTALAYVVYYRMVANVGVTYISLVTFLIPVIALLLGAVFLDESVTLQALAGMAIIALGLAATDERLFKRRSIRHRSK